MDPLGAQEQAVYAPGMIQINTATIGALRDRLLESGGPPSAMVTAPEMLERASHPMAGDDQAIALFEAAFEAMYLMVSVDGTIGAEEHDALRGAIRALTSNTIRTAEIDRLSVDCKARLAKEGVEGRLRAVAAALKGEPTAGEAAFILAAAMAFADNEIADEENEMLNTFAHLLGIEETRANELLDQLEG